MEKPLIYEFTSFNSYFNAWIAHQKELGLNLTQIANRLELYSNAEITNILKDRRKVSTKVLEKFKANAGLSPQECYYADLLGEKDRNAQNVTLNLLISKEIHRLQEVR